MRFSPVVLAVLLALGTNAPAAGPEVALAAFAPRTLPRGPLELALAPARELALEKLGGAACRSVFEALPDFTGRPVARRLEAGERSPSAAFARLRFLDAADGPCTNHDIAAWSVAGDPRVRVCRRTFPDVARRDRNEAAAILIHEALHTLGVAEEAAKEPLTEFVRRRCGL